MHGIVLLLTLVTIAMPSLTPAADDPDDRPNILVILADDLGYADVGFTGAEEIYTPRLDELANNGVIFGNGYVTHPYCGPSRAGLVTGRYQARFWRLEEDDSTWAVGTMTAKYMQQNLPGVGRSFFDMVNDPYETTNIVDQRPEQQAELARLWNEWNRDNVQNIHLQADPYQRRRIEFYDELYRERLEQTRQRAPYIVEQGETAANGKRTPRERACKPVSRSCAGTAVEPLRRFPRLLIRAPGNRPAMVEDLQRHRRQMPAAVGKRHVDAVILRHCGPGHRYLQHAEE